MKAILSQNFFFSSMSTSDLQEVIDAFMPMPYKKGDVIIQQGDTDGKDYYLLVEGLCCTYKTFDNGETKMVKTYNPGEAFGELALLYPVPRQASIIVESDTAFCYALDRTTFQKTILGAWAKKRQLYENFLNKNPLLQSLDSFQRGVIADCLREYEFQPGDKIITAGDVADKRFFFLISGSAIATKRLTQYDEHESTVMRYNDGDYFGELALISDVPRAANVIATSPCRCAGLDRDAFERLLGPCSQVLQTNEQKYKQGEDKAIAQQALTQQMSKMSLNHVETREAAPITQDEEVAQQQEQQ